MRGYNENLSLHTHTHTHTHTFHSCNEHVSFVSLNELLPCECSSEAAFQSLPLVDALKMLSMQSADELADYAAMREREWEVDTKNNVVRFRDDNKTDLNVPSQKLIIETLSYAKELERIV
jgi:26S proteasome regulatory subunit N12